MKIVLALLMATTGAWSAVYVPVDIMAEAKKISRSKSRDEDKLKKLLDTAWEYGLRESPEDATSLGRNEWDDRWSDLSLNAVEKRKQELEAPRLALKSIRRAKLKPADQTNFDLFQRDAESSWEGRRFPSEFLLLNQMSGPQQSIPSTLEQMPQDSVPAFQNILARLRKVPEYLEQNQILLQAGMKKGVCPPKITLRDIPDQVKSLYEKDWKENALYLPFTKIPANFSAEDKSRIEKEAKEILTKSVFPALKKFREFLVAEYIPAARLTIGLSELPDGRAWYDFSLRQMSTTKLSAEAIHKLGLSEVARILIEMEKVKAESGFKGNLAEFKDFLRTESRFFFSSKEELLKAYRDITKRIDPELVRLFGKLPRMTYGVKAIPEYSEKSNAAAYYQRGSYEAARAGYFCANTYDLKSRPKWQMEALALHESVPGHHLQVSLALELDKVPEFRRMGGYTAFSEGWGLYAEGLGAELGLYTDPYAKYGRLSNEIWRAIRLVVDTGIHAKGWTREQAINYFKENSGITEHEIVAEVDRYIVWPGQAVAYKIGELKIKELRAFALKALGAKFDIRKFHDAVLENGGLPLTVLQTQIEKWVAAQK